MMIERAMAQESTISPERPRLTWHWDMFGGGQMTITMTDAQKQPTWRQRFFTRLLFGSIWTRIKEIDLTGEAQARRNSTGC